MTARRIVAVLAVVTLAGCGGSDDDPALVPDTSVDTVVSDDELRDGVFEENDGQTEPGGAPTSSATTVAGQSPVEAGTDPTTTTAPSAGEGSTTGDGSTAGTTDGSATGSGTSGSGTGSTQGTDPASSDTDGGTTSGSGTGGDSGTDATTGGTDGTSGSTGSTGEVEALTGVVAIGDDTYTFGVDECSVTDTMTSARGDRAIDGSPFIVRVTSNVVDIDADGAPDTTIEIDVDTDGAGGDEAFTLVGMRSATLNAAFDVEFSVTADRIRASGPTVDTSIGETVPMVLDVRCS